MDISLTSLEIRSLYDGFDYNMGPYTNFTDFVNRDLGHLTCIASLESHTSQVWSP